MDINEVDKIMQERIVKFNSFVMQQDIEKMPVGLFNGKIGISIFFYHQARLYNNKKYEQFARKLISSIYNQLNTKSIINLEDGLVGICLGIMYLIENKYIVGNINSILKELDEKIYHTMTFNLTNSHSNSEETMRTIIEVALYCTFRLNDMRLSKEDRFIFESLIIKAINYTDTALYYSDRLNEPYSYSFTDYLLPNYLYLLSLVYNHNFYNYKIEKQISEIKITSIIPQLNSNRMLLALSLEQLPSELKSLKINKHIDILNNNTDIEYIIQSEFRNKNLLLANGLCGLYFQQKLVFNKNRLPSELILKKITESELWDDVYKDIYKLNATLGLFTGMGGIIFIYQKIIKSYLSK